MAEEVVEDEEADEIKAKTEVEDAEEAVAEEEVLVEAVEAEEVLQVPLLEPSQTGVALLRSMDLSHLRTHATTF